MASDTEGHNSKRTYVKLDLDLSAVLTGFGSASAPTPAHHRILNHYSSVLLVGPAKSDDLLDLVMHMFTDDEADLVRFLPPLRPRTAEKVARLAGRSAADATRTLDNLADNKRVILSYGEPKKYTILPVLPGTFEMALLTPDISRTNSWHKKFAEIFERIWDTGFLMDYMGKGPPQVRYFPVGAAADTIHMAWPAGRLEEILDLYDTFAIGHCQCRLSMSLAGKGCGKPTENCVAMGPLSEGMISRGLMRRAEKKEIVEAKIIAEQNGCVTWMFNTAGDKRGNGSCSCCGCCCHGLRTVSQFSAPGFVSKPQFIPQLIEQKCNSCGACAKACPMGAWKKSDAGLQYDSIRCIGCGLCVVSCKPGALELKPSAHVRPPERNFNMLFGKGMPGYIASAAAIKMKRAFGGK